jgi:hypothetical protein
MIDAKKYEILNLQTIARYIFIAVVILFMGVSCSSDDTEVEPEETEFSVNWRSTHTIKELKNKFGSGTVTLDTVIFKAVIISTDANKNFANKIFLQDAEAGILIGVSPENISGNYNKGTEVYVLATGMKYSAATNELSFAENTASPAELLEKHLNVIATGQSIAFQIIANLSTIKQEFASRLVKIYSVQFEETLAGLSIVSDGKDTDRKVTDPSGNAITVRVKFAPLLAIFSLPFANFSILNESILVFVNSSHNQHS